MQWKIQFPDNSVGKESACNAGDPGLIPGLGRSAGEGISYPPQYSWVSLVAQLVKNLPAVWETWVRSLGWEDPLKKGKATQSSILAWRIPWTVESMGSQRVRHYWVTFTFTQLCLTLCDSMDCSTPGFPVHHQLPQLTQTHFNQGGDAIQPSHPLSSLSTPAFNVSQHQGLFQWVSSLHQVATVLELQHLSFEYSQLIFFRIDWFNLAVQGTLKSLLQHHSSKASIFQCSAFFRVQLSHLYMPTGKTITLTRQTFVGKVMSLLFDMLSRLVTAFLSRSKRLLISWLQSPSAVIFGAPQNKVCHCFHCWPIYLPWSDGTRCHDLSFLNVEF